MVIKLKRKIIDKDKLFKLYYTNKYTYEEISKEFDCCIDTVKRSMDRFDFKPRSHGYYSKGNRYAAGDKNHRWGGGDDQYWKQQLIKIYGHSCQVCGFNIIIQVHHIDGNRKNNQIDNFVLLCPNCHFSLHHASYVLNKEEENNGNNFRFTITPVYI